MSESPESKKPGNPDDQKNSSRAIPEVPPTVSSGSSLSKPEVITEKFLAVAKEKDHLESVIMQQSDMIKDLEKEKSELALSLKILSESHRKMKDKLLDFDILRNMEISEFKKKIENLMAENKRLLSEKDLIFTNLDRDQKNIAALDTEMSQSLLKEKEELETRLNSAIEELKQLRIQIAPEKRMSRDNELPADQSPSEDVGDKTREAVLLDSRLREMALDRDEAKAELYHARAEIERLGADKTRVEEALQKKIAEYNEEVASLRIDIDELTSAMESKIRDVDEVQAKATRLSEELMHKDNELHEQIPALLEKMDTLSLSIDKKMEENSLFAQELSDLNMKISSLDDELTRKDELFTEITEDCRKQKEEMSALRDMNGQSRQNLQEENDRLRQEIDRFKSAASENEKIIEMNKNEKDLLERKSAESGARIDALSSENAALAAAVAEKDATVADLQQQLARLSDIGQQAAAEADSQITALREQLLVLNQQLLEKNEMLTILSSKEHAKSDTLSSENAALAAAAAEKDAAVADLQQQLARLSDIGQQAAAEADSQIAALREQLLLLNQQLLEKNEMLTVLSSKGDAKSDALFSENAALAAAVAEKDAAVADLQQQLTRLSDIGQQAAAEADSQIASLREQLLLLNQQLLEKNEMLTVLSSDRLHEIDLLASREAELNALKDETDGLRESLSMSEKQLSSYQSQMDHALNDKGLIETQLEDAVEKLQELAIEQKRLSSLTTEKDHSLALAVTECNAIRRDNEDLKQKIRDLEEALSENKPAPAPADIEQEQALRSTREYQETFERLKDEIISLNRTIAEKEQQINQLNSDKIALINRSAEQQSILEQSQLAITDLNNRIRQLQEKYHFSENERMGLLETLGKQKIELEILQKDRDLQSAELNKGLASYAETLADLRSKLDQSMRQHDFQGPGLQSVPGTSERITQKKESQTLPVRLATTEAATPRAGKHSLTYALLAILLVVIIGATFYAYNTGLLVLPDRTAIQQPEPKKELSYQELFALLNRSVAEGLKFQATLITEPLVLKSEEPADRSLFDFQHYLYFKINISSPRDGLDTTIANDPYSRILLSAGTTTVNPLPEKKVKEIKTFYRKESPVSIVFYCAFPKEILVPDISSLKLSLKKDGVPSTLIWDLQLLRANNIIP